jgi:hypothetical protein
MEFIEVVTRYGKKHLARGFDPSDTGRFFTLCMGTSSWTVASWENMPDHPLLTIEEIRALEMNCESCKKLSTLIA